jgi:hypothetical protein
MIDCYASKPITQVYSYLYSYIGLYDERIGREVMGLSKLLRRFIVMLLAGIWLSINWNLVYDYSAVIVAGFLTYLLCELY